MPSFYDLLKYAKTGIASPDIAAYDKMRALAMAGAKYPIQTITGVPPIRFKSDGSPLAAWSIAGNRRQDGTDAPQFVGVRTNNLFNWAAVMTGYRITWATGATVQDESAIMSDFIPVSVGIYRANASFNLVGYDANKAYVGTYDPYTMTFRKEYGSKTSYYDISDVNVAYVKLMSYSATDTLSAATMLNTGTTVLPFEPHGYKIDITCSGQTTPIYIGDPLRKAIDGSDAVDVLSSTGTITRAVDADGNALETPTTQIIEVPPEIPTVRGSNTLSVGTDVQPSSMSVTGHIKHVA